MKKICSIVIILVLIISLSACATIHKDLELSQNTDNVQVVEIYNPDHAYYEGDIHLFLEENAPVSVLEEEVLSAFVDELAVLKFKEEKVFFPIPMDGGYNYEGYIIVVVYSDGGYDIIAKGGLYSYAVGKDGQGKYKYEHSDYCGETPWEDFIEKYIDK